MVIVRGVLRVILIWVLSGVAAPFIRRAFMRLARLAPSGSFLESTLVELSAGWSVLLIAVAADVLSTLVIESLDFLFLLAAALRLRPAGNSSAALAQRARQQS
jgi:hypothetical protein